MLVGAKENGRAGVILVGGGGSIIPEMGVAILQLESLCCVDLKAPPSSTTVRRTGTAICRRVIEAWGRGTSLRGRYLLKTWLL